MTEPIILKRNRELFRPCARDIPNSGKKIFFNFQDLIWEHILQGLTAKEWNDYLNGILVKSDLDEETKKYVLSKYTLDESGEPFGPEYLLGDLQTMGKEINEIFGLYQKKKSTRPIKH